MVVLEDDDVEEDEVGALFGSYSLSSTSVASVRMMVRSPEFEPPIDAISFHHREVCERYIHGSVGYPGQLMLHSSFGNWLSTGGRVFPQ